MRVVFMTQKINDSLPVEGKNGKLYVFRVYPGFKRLWKNVHIQLFHEFFVHVQHSSKRGLFKHKFR